jgi:chromosome segregation ATPase
MHGWPRLVEQRDALSEMPSRTELNNEGEGETMKLFSRSSTIEAPTPQMVEPTPVVPVPTPPLLPGKVAEAEAAWGTATGEATQLLREAQNMATKEETARQQVANVRDRLAQVRDLAEAKTLQRELEAAERELNLIRVVGEGKLSDSGAAQRRAGEAERQMKALQARAEEVRRAILEQEQYVEQVRRKHQELVNAAEWHKTTTLAQAEGTLANLRKELCDLVGQ